MNNNPLAFVDPSGRCIWDACVAEGYATYAAVTAIAAGAIYLSTPQGQQMLQNTARAVSDGLNSLATSLANTLQPGPYAGGSIPAKGPGRDFHQGEHQQINDIGDDTGCHSCGATEPGTKSGNWVLDHQPPTKVNTDGAPQRLYPKCLSCSRQQGGQVRGQQQKQQPQKERSAQWSLIGPSQVLSSWDSFDSLQLMLGGSEAGTAVIPAFNTYGGGGGIPFVSSTIRFDVQ